MLPGSSKLQKEEENAKSTEHNTEPRTKTPLEPPKFQPGERKIIHGIAGALSGRPKNPPTKSKKPRPEEQVLPMKKSRVWVDHYLVWC